MRREREILSHAYALIIRINEYASMRACVAQGVQSRHSLTSFPSSPRFPVRHRSSSAQNKEEAKNVCLSRHTRTREQQDKHMTAEANVRSLLSPSFTLSLPLSPSQTSSQTEEQWCSNRQDVASSSVLSLSRSLQQERHREGERACDSFS